MRLCKELGGMTLEEMLNRMSGNEMAEWQAYYLLEHRELEDQNRAARVEAGRNRIKGKLRR
jgi:hypothetical protein